jgi:drug/metabolite transporter (DMT)-like permease
VRKPLRTVIALFSQKWWTVGYGVAIVAWLLHVGALNFAPLSIVQAVLASGFVILGVVAERWFGFKLGKRQWAGIVITAVGLALLAVTSAQTSQSEQSDYGLTAAIAFQAALVIGGVLLILGGRSERMAAQQGVMLGAAAGLLFTVSHIGIKALTGMVSFTDPASFLTLWSLVVVGAFVAAFFASARSLQVGDAVPVIAVTGVSSNAAAILGGVVVFRDPIGDNEFIVGLRIAAFALVIIAVALLPAPVRAAGMTGDSDEGDDAESADRRSRRPVPGAAEPAGAG